MIEAQALKKTFGKVTAVQDLSFEAADGKVTGLLGPNGAGKTTSLRMLAGLLRPASGRLAVGGVDGIAHPMELKRRLGVLPDAPGLYVRLTGREHLEYAGRLCGLSGAALHGAVDAQIDRLGMRGFIERRAEGYSQGERRKVALARALVSGPQHLLLDEPTNGLDVMSARALRREIRAQADGGRCVLFSSHQMHEVAELCDHIVIVARGQVVAAGTTTELLQRTGRQDLEGAFIDLIGSEEGLST